MDNTDYIKLHNRDHADIWLEKAEDDWYILNSDGILYMKYLRLIISEDGTIEAFDPPGGPFTRLGTTLGGKIVSKIVNEAGTIKVKLI